MISLSRAWELIDQNTSVLGETNIPINECAGWVASQEIVAPIDVCPFRNSAMDGFAVSTKIIKDLPVTLEHNQILFAGGNKEIAYDDSKAVKVMTGALVPDMFDAVIPFEDTNYDNNSVTISKPVKVGQHIRLPGEDVVVGEKIVSRGTVINALIVGVLASLGMESVKVVRKPRVLIINTGDELLQPGEPLKKGFLYDSNGPAVQSMVSRFCMSVKRRPIAGDDLDELSKELESDHDIIITTGGVSAGEKDFIPAASEKAGWKELFHKVAIKPGKPVFCATQKDKLLVGLPGNPLSAAVTCALFVLPALKKMAGLVDYKLQLDEAELEGEPIKSNRPIIWPGRIENIDGSRVAKIAAKRSSAALSALVDSDGLIFQNFSDDYKLPKVRVCLWSNILTP